MKIIRIVKMQLQEEHLASFLMLFDENKEKIRAFSGCTHLEMLQDRNNPYIIFTYSHWNDENDLENYRHSNLFKNIWKQVKPLFSRKTEAWSLEHQFLLP